MNEAGIGLLAAPPPALSGSVAIPVLWVAIVVAFVLGSAFMRAGNKGLGIGIFVLGVILLLSTTLGAHLAAGIKGLING